MTLLRIGILALLLPACLDPLSEDEVDPDRVFGDRSITPENAPHVEDNPNLTAEVAQFPGEVSYLRGFADGEPVRYFNIGGPVPRFIAPAYFVEDREGNPVGRPIIDAIPGQTGYSPWWRRVVARTTDRYAGEPIHSREALDLAVRLGLLEPAAEQTRVIDAPVLLRGTRVALGNGTSATTAPVWYRNQRVDWIDFKADTEVPIEERDMPIFPVYVFQRIDQGAPLYEFATGVDLNGDQVLDASNNIFASNRGGPRYSPMWFGTIVRASADFPSIDRPPGRPGLRAESEFLAFDEGGPDPFLASGFTITSSVVVSVNPVPSLLVNCPIQAQEGAF